MSEPLEARRLFAAAGLGAAGDLIRYNQAIAAYASAGATGAGQTIAVIDSGIDYTHPSLGGAYGPGHKVVGGHDFVDNDNDPMDVLGHGTEVAGILAADPYVAGGVNYQGIAPAAKLVALRIDDGDEATPVPDSKLEAALKWVVDHRTEFGITVVNISYGQGEYATPTVSTVYGDEIQELRDDGVTIVASAGNNDPVNLGINSPAADPNVISVGSVETNDTISPFGKRGAQLKLLAPGDDILTTFAGGGYGVVSGTSYASPVVAGAVALMRNIDPTLKPADTLSVLRASGKPNFDGDTESGDVTRRTYPRLDLLNALDLTSARKPGSTAAQAAVGQFGNGSALAVDAQGVTHYVYYDSGAKKLKYATRSTAGAWSSAKAIGSQPAFQGYYLSLALDPQGQPAVAYFDGTNGDLEYAKYDGSAWTVTPVDVKNSVGLYPSLVFDRDGLPLISYYRKTTGDLKVARADASGTWTSQTIASSGDVGRSTSAAVDANGRVGVAYEDSTHGWLDYAVLNPRTNVWATTIVDKATHGVSFISTAFSTADQSPWISYYDASPANLKVAAFVNRAWTPQTLVSRGATGLYTTLFFAGADEPNVLYYDKRRDTLNLATRADDGGWSVLKLQDDAGRFASAAVDDLQQMLRYSYFDASGNLKIGEVNVSGSSVFCRDACGSHKDAVLPGCL